MYYHPSSPSSPQQYYYPSHRSMTTPYKPQSNLYHNKMTDSNYNIQPEQVNSPNLSQEFEEEKNTSPCVSHELPRTPLELQKLHSSLTVDPNPQFSRADQLGPWYAKTTNFGPNVSGNATLILQRNGSFSFRGHFHISGAVSSNYAFAWAVSANDTVYVFAHKGFLHGTFDTGSRDDDWSWSQIIPMIATDWSALEQGRNHWLAQSGVTDLNVFIDNIATQMAGTPYVRIVKIIV
ncbi:hypothetical protein [Bacillus cereus]|uniref:hypothetical protein n=1 Tax=Bacillus cereus TaxID=1396 RepID=UPI000BF626C3|nr:hypothetical protein [Bacillus cereus]PFQ30091.1 hypothetical protein COK33_28745 [Bacillus cereus]PGX49135.1 hypothetical protein COE29_23795 [Bacillus cereus]